MIGEAVQAALRDAVYATDWARTGSEALSALSCHAYDAVLLDLGLPGRDGMQVLRELRAGGQRVPVIIMTARDGLEDRVQGLDDGADDYVLKPFDMSELLARLRAVLRRRDGRTEFLLSNGIVSLNRLTHEARVADGQVVSLTHREFGLLQALLTRPGAILSRAELEERLYGWGEEVESNAIDFLIHALRKKLGNAVIRNIRGAGWMVAKSR